MIHFSDRRRPKLRLIQTETNGPKGLTFDGEDLLDAYLYVHRMKLPKSFKAEQMRRILAVAATDGPTLKALAARRQERRRVHRSTTGLHSVA